jgi:hypothetical protein
MGDQMEMPVRTTLRRAGRCTTGLLTLAAWLILSNHCLFGFSEATADTVARPDECPMHAAAPAKEKPAAKIPCCKEIRALLAKSVTMVLTLAARPSAGQEYAKAAFPPPLRHTVELRSLDTGPPGCFSFAELVLQESMRAHAPPVS